MQRGDRTVEAGAAVERRNYDAYGGTGCLLDVSFPHAEQRQRNQRQGVAGNVQYQDREGEQEQTGSREEMHHFRHAGDFRFSSPRHRPSPAVARASGRTSAPWTFPMIYIKSISHSQHAFLSPDNGVRVSGETPTFLSASIVVSIAGDDAADAVLRGQTPADQSLIRRTNTGIPSHASANGAAGLAHGGPCDAYAVDSCPAYSTSDGNLCHHVVRAQQAAPASWLAPTLQLSTRSRDSDQSEHCCPPMAVPVDPTSAYQRRGSRLR